MIGLTSRLPSEDNVEDALGALEEAYCNINEEFSASDPGRVKHGASPKSSIPMKERLKLWRTKITL